MTQTPAEPTPLTVPAFAEWLGANAEDPGVASALMVGINEVEKRCGPILPKTRTLTVYQTGAHLVLPATRLEGTVVVTTPAGTAVTPSQVDLLAGIVTVVGGHRPGPWTVTITPTPPADGETNGPRDVSLVEAAYVIAGQVFNARRGRRGRPQSSGSEVPDGTPAGFAIPARALELMANYRVIFS